MLNQQVLAMAHEVVVPRLGWTMEEGIFLQWLKRDGDPVRAGENLFVLEGEKSAQEVESVDNGVLRIPPDGPPPGTTVKVGAVLAYLLEPGERPPWERPSPAPAQQTSAPIAPATMAEPCESRGISVDASRTCNEPAISPRARRIAEQLGINWRALNGSGRTGRIRERDVRAAAPHLGEHSPRGPRRVIPFSPVRKIIAQRMVAGAHSAAPVTLTTRVDATNLVNLRDQFKALAQEPAPSYTDLMVKLVAAALQDHPALNRAWSEDGLVEPDGIHIGIAVDTDFALVVPVIRDVTSLSLRDVARRSRALIELARARRLAPEDSQDGTFTITNLGMYGVEGFTPIINVPQCAILGMGRIAVEPAVREGQVVPRAMMTLSLTFDHRIVDGAPAARFLNCVREFAEQPGPRLIS
jgi:pyruvate dehydrogenase E2 component (dihydrolipoamide acetyltransferase)